MKLIPLNVRDMRRNWEKMGKNDPFWAVLTEDAKKGSRWDAREFFSTGEKEIAGIMDYVQSLGLQVRREQALDFGCGLGRLTQALGAHFPHVLGLDISSSMVEQARSLNARGEVCEFRVNADADLRQVSSNTIDFIYSSITLQHIDPEYSRVYLAEFIRVLRPGGVLVFQLPDRRTNEAVVPAAGSAAAQPPSLKRFYWAAREALHNLRLRWIYRLRILRNAPIIPMHGIARAEVEKLLQDAGARLVDAQPDTSAGPQWVSYRYCVQKS